MSSNNYVTTIGISGAILGVLLQSGALFYVIRKFRRLQQEFIDILGDCNALKDEVTMLKVRLNTLENQTKNGGAQSYNVRFALPLSEQSSLPMSRVDSMTSSSTEYCDALEELLGDEKTALLSNTNNGKVVNMKEIDNLHESGNYSKCYEILKKTVESEPQNVEALWRFARACHNLSSGYDQKNAKRKELVVEGHKIAVKAYNIDPKTKNFPVVKWVAVLTGGLTEYLGTKQKIEEGYKFKAYLDHGLTLDPTEYSLLHMRGRFKFSVANLSWLERKAASAFFASPPTATIDEALEDFLEVEKLKPVSWIDNLIYVARCYLAKSNKQEAAKYLKQAQTVKAEDESDAEALQEVEKLLKTCK